MGERGLKSRFVGGFGRLVRLAHPGIKIFELLFAWRDDGFGRIRVEQNFRLGRNLKHRVSRAYQRGNPAVAQ